MWNQNEKCYENFSISFWKFYSLVKGAEEYNSLKTIFPVKIEIDHT